MQQISLWRTWVVAGLLMAMPATVTAQEGEFTLDDLFATPKLTGTTPSRPVWAPNSEHFAFPGVNQGILDVASGYPQAMERKCASVPIQHPRQCAILSGPTRIQSSACEVTTYGRHR